MRRRLRPALQASVNSYTVLMSSCVHSFADHPTVGRRDQVVSDGYYAGDNHRGERCVLCPTQHDPVGSAGLGASVVIATYNRPEHVHQCLVHLERQTLTPVETVVVDASPDRHTRDVVARFPHVRYARNDLGRGHTATSRSIGMALTRGEVVAFLDDDAYAEPEWLAQLLARYEAGVGAVGGRARNGIAGEENEGLDAIGRLLDNGVLTGNFAADPGRDIEVDHLLGANMSVLRSAVERLGGIHDLSLIHI